MGVARNFAKFLPKLPNKKPTSKGRDCKLHVQLKHQHSNKSFLATKVESLIMLWKWMLLNGWDHPSLWNGLRTSFWMDETIHPFEMDEDILWNGCDHPLECMTPILVKWEYPCEMDENILLDGRKTSHPWSLDLWCLDETSLSWQRIGWMDGWMDGPLSHLYILTPRKLEY